MRPNSVTRRLNSIPNLSRQGKRINGLFRLLACPLIWEQAYEAIAPNKGALTPGTNPQNTLDGFSLERADGIIGAVMGGTYRFTPARRQYIPKANGKLRPLGIPTADDKLVQAAVKILLEHVYEPIFSDHSHGFRKGRSCHTALREIQRTWHGTKWLVEVDVVGFFDNVDHDILLNLLQKRIEDERLIGLIGQMLKAGYMEDWTYHNTYSGTPQGGVISPILANIYLHELDQFMEEQKAKFDKGKGRRRSQEYLTFGRMIEIRRRMIQCRERKEDFTEIPKIQAEIRELHRRRREAPAVDWFDPDYRRLLYCRYADDFVIGVIGAKADACDIMSTVKNFLTDRLRLQASEEKSGVRKADEGADFLGYTLRTHNSRKLIRLKQGGPKSGRIVTRRVASDRMQLHAPHDKLAKFVERKRLGNYYTVRGEPRPELINNSDAAILIGYNVVMRGLAEYYKLGTGWKDEIGRVQHIWLRSLVNTLARKYDASAAKIFQRLRQGDRYGLRYEVDGKRRFIPVFRMADVKPTAITRAEVDQVPNRDHYLASRTDTIDRLKARTCEACGATSSLEVHHVRRMRDTEGTTLWNRVRAARTRKRIVLCRPCHVAHHSGRMQARLDSLGASVGAG